MPIRENLRSSLIDAIFFSFMVGTAETYLAAFVLHQGHSALAAGLVNALPLIAGAILQLISPFVVRRWGSYKKWVVASATLQALSLIVLGLCAALGSVSILAIYLVISVYWGLGMGTGSAWNAWMSHIVPGPVRTSFFSRRIMWSQVALVAGQICGGVALQVVSASEARSSVFAALFGLAGSARLVSAGFLGRQTEVPVRAEDAEGFSLASALKLFRQSSLKRVLIFLVYLHLSIFLAAGFFNPYMLQELKLGFVAYMALLTAAYGGRVLATSFGRKLVSTRSPRTILTATTLGMALTPMGWTLWQNYFYLVFLQVVSGFAWGLFELMVFMMLFNGLSLREKTQLLTFYNLVQTTAIVIGAALGGLVFHFAGFEDRTAYHAIFLISGAARLLALGFLPGFAWKQILPLEWIDIRPLTVRTFGALGRPLLMRRIRRRRRRRSRELPRDVVAK